MTTWVIEQQDEINVEVRDKLLVIEQSNPREDEVSAVYVALSNVQRLIEAIEAARKEHGASK